MPKLNWKHILVLVAVCLLCYFNIFSHGLCLDDAYIFTQLPQPSEGISGVFSVFNKLYGHTDYRPMVVFSYTLEVWLFNGIHLWISHGINLLLYILLSLLIYQTLLRLPIRNGEKIALLITILFITHPVHSSVVSSLKNRDNILSMLFGTLSWYFSIRALNKKWTGNWIIAAFFLSLALFSKLDALNFFFIIPLTVFIFYPEQWKKALPVAVVLFFALLLRVTAGMHFSAQSNSVSFTENPIVHDWTFSNRIIQFLQTLYEYVRFLVIPKGYWFYFGYDTLKLDGFTLQTVACLLLLILFLGTAYWFRKREKLITFGILFFYASLLYCSNIYVPVAGIIADRYAFIASLGFCIALVPLLEFILQSFAGSKNKLQKVPAKSKETPRKTTPGLHKGLYVIIAIICLINIYFTIHRNDDWKDMDSLLKADMPHLTNSFEANRIAASVYFKKGIENATNADMKRDYLQQGLYYALQAQQVYDSNQYINESIGQAYFNLHKPDAAVRQLRKTIRMFDTSRISLEVLGDIYFLKNKMDSSAYFYSQAVRTFPFYDEVYFKYMNTLFHENKFKEAETFSNELIKKYPDRYLPYQCLSYYLMETRDSLDGLIAYKISFEKGYRNREYAVEVQNKFLRMGDTLNARRMEKYIKE